MVQKSKHEYLEKIKDRYRRAGKKAKAIILDEFCDVCGYNRKHAIRLLNSDGRRRKKKPGQPSKYAAAEVQVLENLWLNTNRPCSSRLGKKVYRSLIEEGLPVPLLIHVCYHHSVRILPSDGVKRFTLHVAAAILPCMPSYYEIPALKRRSPLPLVGWLLLSFCAAAAGAFVNTGGWYAELAKPAWNPPGWVFGPVWTVLYCLMAVAAWLVWQRGGWKQQRGPLSLYLVQLALNAAWTPIFFGLQRPGLAFAEILLLVTAVYVTALVFLRTRPSAGILLIPYALWVSFAAVLNLTIWRMNG